METLGEILKLARTNQRLILRKVAAAVDIDPSLISKFEKNERRPTKEQVVRLANYYNLKEKDLLINWYSERIVESLKYSDAAVEILKVAEEKIKYYNQQKNGK